MAIDPLQRGMFRRPGLNIADITGGIMSGVADQPTTQVAAQPIQVASLRERPSGTPDAFSNWIQEVYGLVGTPQERSPERTMEQWNKLSPSVRNELLRNSPPPPPSDKFQLQEDGGIVRMVAPAVAAEELSPAAGELSPATEKEPSVDPADLQPIIDAADQAGKAAVNNNEVSEEQAAGARTVAEDVTSALSKIEDPEASEDEILTAAFKALGVNDIAGTDYNANAKKILGIDPREKDVPEWAAPMFMFGLKLMQGPVTGKTEGRSLLGGFLGDVGAAGAAAFPMMAAEKARKRKEKAAVGQMAYQLRAADVSSRAAAVKLITDNLWKGREFEQEQQAQDFKNINTSVARMLKPYENDPDNYTAVMAEWSSIYGGLTAAQQRKVARNPAAQNILASEALSNAGVVSPLVTNTLKFGSGQELTYNTKAVANLAKKLKMSQGALLNAIVKDPDNELYKSVAIATTQGDPNYEDDVKVENGISNVYVIDTKAKQEYLASLPKGSPVDESQYRRLVSSYVTDKPGMTKIDLGTDDQGSPKHAYIDMSAFARARIKNKELTITEVLQNPVKYRDIISGQYSNTSGATGNIQYTTVFTGPESEQKVIFNKRKWLELSEEIAAQRPGITASQLPIDALSFDELVAKGVYTPVGEEKVTGTPETWFYYDPVSGEFESFSGGVGAVAGMKKGKQQEDFLTVGKSVLSANRISGRIAGILYDKSAMAAVTGATDAKAKVAALGRLLGLGPNFTFSKASAEAATRGAFSKLRDYRRTNAEDTELVEGYLKDFDAVLISDWGGASIKDAAVRQQLKSMMVDLAFQVASAREAGKLTDNDVRWAFETLGFNTTDWLQNPEVVMAGLTEAMGTINSRFAWDLQVAVGEEQWHEMVGWNEETQKAENPQNAVDQWLGMRSRGMQGFGKGWGDERYGDNRYQFDLLDKDVMRAVISGEEVSGPLPTLSAEQLSTDNSFDVTNQIIQGKSGIFIPGENIQIPLKFQGLWQAGFKGQPLPENLPELIERTKKAREELGMPEGLFEVDFLNFLQDSGYVMIGPE
jgi:hypothetical protein